MTRHVIAPVDELPPGTRKFLTIDERPIAVFNINGEFFGLLNRCPHQGAALCEGPLIGLAQFVRSRRDRIHQARRNHPLPLARLGVRYPHRPVLLRPETISRQGLSRQCRAGRERGEGAVRGGDDRGVGGKRLRGGGFVNSAVIPGREPAAVLVIARSEATRQSISPRKEGWIASRSLSLGGAGRRPVGSQ